DDFEKITLSLPLSHLEHLSENVATRWIKTIPIKVNVFAWKLHLDRLPTRSNLLKRGIQVQSSLYPICNVLQEDASHLFFSCDVALAISRIICQWWNISWSPVDSYSGWLEWFNSIRLGSKLKGILEGVFYVSWWCLWNFRNQLLFASKKPRKETLFDDVVSRSFIWSNSRCNLKLPTRVNLSRRGVLLDSHLCPLCNAAMEDVQHVLRCYWLDCFFENLSLVGFGLAGDFVLLDWMLGSYLSSFLPPPNRSNDFDDIVFLVLFMVF
ncbi:RNA-directed DNA polymerase, eukaryota, partial [Tanacetum coccineum]